MWVCTTRLPTPATQGAIARSPAASAADTTRKAKKGRTAALAGHTSNSNSLPRASWSPATATATASIVSVPPIRRAATTASDDAAMLTSIAPTARPTHGPSRRTAGAIASKYRGPGLLTCSPTTSDADVHIPSSG